MLAAFVVMLRSFRVALLRTPSGRALAKDAPTPRPVQAVADGEVIAFPEVGGLHHRYE